ncbi:MAG: FAD-dependent oxidoreductase [Betaproteobacteria bacterium]|nr:FAD-dependent oxidoreductase [Betaproteobacteria bacterium]
MKVAIIGAGIAGNTVAHRLHRQHDITLFEAGGHVGGHSHTHSVELDGERHDIDTGFIVFNDRTYPNFVALLRELGVASRASSMSFSIRNEGLGLEYNGSSLNTLFAQRSNLLRPSFYRMLRDILRFNREAPQLLAGGPEITLGDYLQAGGYSRGFVGNYLVPMGAAIWSTDPVRMLSFPARYFVRFLHNHGMLSVNDRPQWRTVAGGSARYVEKLVAPFRSRILLDTPVASVRRQPDGVWVKARGLEARRFDQVFLACHSDQALRLLQDATPQEREVLGAIAYQRNEAVLHTDTALLPRRRLAWAAWNYHVLQAADCGREAAGGTGTAPATLTYNMNILQGLRSRHTFCVTLNRSTAIDPDKVIKRVVYDHPLYTVAAVAAQQRQREVNGGRRTYFCGAYWRFGFHEDGVASALTALDHFEEDAHAQRHLPRVA